ncbi:MAG: transglutaminase domain-containing protein [Tepidisphaeraceae bacterium]|jgi:hypothetical protein
MANAATLCEENLGPTPILDYQQKGIQDVANWLDRLKQARLAYLQAAHKVLAEKVAPIYSLDELQPASMTLAKGNGSCSQRFACLEAIARAKSIATRVRGLWIDGRFWAPRFRLARQFLPRRILLAWPQFHLDDNWLGVESLFDNVEVLAAKNPKPFANDSESLFDAVKNTAVDFDGKTGGCAGSRCDLSRFVVEDAGTFTTRDKLFATYPLLQRTLRGVLFGVLFGDRKSI